MNKTIDQIELEANKKIPREEVSLRDGGAGKKLSYLASHYVIDRMNTVFGVMGWDAETVEMRQVNKETERPAYVSKVRITALVKHGDDGFMRVVKEGYGFGSDKSGLNPHEMAVKEAESDAFKRAARQFGMSLGLALYSKEQENVEDAPKAVAKAAKPAPTQTVAPKSVIPEGVLDAPARMDKLLSDREALNKRITAMSNVILAKAGPSGAPERAAKAAELKALVASKGAETKEALTDVKAAELLTALEAMANA